MNKFTFNLVFASLVFAHHAIKFLKMIPTVNINRAVAKYAPSQHPLFYSQSMTATLLLAV